MRELTCGTTMPSLGIIQIRLQGHRLTSEEDSGEEGGEDGEMELVLADYNADVLRLATLPNLLLVWTTTTCGEPLEDGVAAIIVVSNRNHFIGAALSSCPWCSHYRPYRVTGYLTLEILFN